MTTAIDPINLILEALATDIELTAEKVAKGTYSQLKTLIQQNSNNNSSGKSALAGYKTD